MGKGILHHKTGKQKLNTKSSTESEIVGASDYLPHAIWMRRFLMGQGYKVKRSILFQDNESAIKMQANGYMSRGERSRHIDIRYFFVKDVLQREGIEIKHCKTEMMTADFFTKPLQGKLFKKIRSEIMGHSEIPIEERVEVKMKDAKLKMETHETIGTQNEHRMQMTYAEAVSGRKEMSDDVRQMMRSDVRKEMKGGNDFSKR